MVTAAPACKAALAQATALWPERSRLSDGILPDDAHTIRSPTSDHELGDAYDVTHDPAHGVDCNLLAQQAADDPRIKYIIWREQIFNPAVSLLWRPYSGSNPHTSHMHVSIRSTCRDDTSPWWDPLVPIKEPAVPDNPDLPNIEGPLTLHLLQDQNGMCQGYAIFGTMTGEIHGHGPGWRYWGRSEDPTPDDQQ
jgi:hypothetical protein